MLSFFEWNVNPQIIDLGFIELRWYSLLFLTGFILGYWILSRIFRKEDVPIILLDKLTIYVVVSAILGARIGHCLFYEPHIYLQQPLSIILPFQGTPGIDFEFTGYQGLASHGGGIGLLIGLYLYARRFRLPYLWILDRITLVTPLAGAMIRIGNFFNSEILGLPTALPWAVKFLRLYPAEIPAGQIPALHPAQLYEAVCYLVIFVILLQVYYQHHPDIRQGLLTGLFLLTVFSARFLIEFVKKDQEKFDNPTLLNMGQWLSIPFILLGIYLVFKGPPVKQVSA